MLLALGIGIIVTVLIYAAVATWQSRITAAGFFGVGLIGVMAGATVTKLPFFSPPRKTATPPGSCQPWHERGH